MKRREQATGEHGRGALKIGEVARRSGIGIETLRFYERTGLLGQPARTESGYRLYDADVLDQLEFIKRAQALGFSLSEIGQIIHDKRGGRSPCGAVRDIVRRRLGELDEELAQLKRYRNELAAALRVWDEVEEVEGHVCGLIEGTRIEHAAPGRRGVGRRKR